MEWACDARATGPLAQSERAVLVIMAKYAQPDGSRVFCGRRLISEHTGLSIRSVSRALHALRAGGLIDYGDQSWVAHFPYWSRPVVYNLSVGVRGTPPETYEDYSSDADVAEIDGYDPVPDPVTQATPGDTGDTPCQPCHPVTQPVAPGDRTGSYPVTQVSPKPKTETNYRTPPVVPRAASTCRRCDGAHSDSQPCHDFYTDHDTGLTNVRAAMRAKPERLDERAADLACDPTREERIA